MRAVAKAAIVTTGTGGTTKTLLQVLAGTNHAFKITEVGVTFDGIDNLALPIQVQLIRQTDAGTASSLTMLKSTEENSDTIDAAAQEIFTVEPTSTDIIRDWYIHPQGGVIYNPPDPEELIVPGGARIAIRTIMGAGATAVNCIPYIEIDE